MTPFTSHVHSERTDHSKPLKLPHFLPLSELFSRDFKVNQRGAVLIALQWKHTEEAAAGKMSGWISDVFRRTTASLLCLVLGLAPASASGTQDVYRAPEHGNATLTWWFPLKADAPAASVYIDIQSMKLSRSIYLYDSRFGAVLHQDELYRDRVWCDLELAKKGRIECLFIDLRLNDTDTYTCIGVFGEESHSGRRDLNVTGELTAQPSLAVNETSQPASRGRIGLYVPAGLFSVLTAALSVRCWCLSTNVTG